LYYTVRLNNLQVKYGVARKIREKGICVVRESEWDLAMC